MAKKTEEPEVGTEDHIDWKHDVAYKLVDLYVKELTERKDKKVLNIECLVEAYLYVLGRLEASEHEMGGLVSAIRDELKKRPEAVEKSGIKEAIGEKKINAGLLKALENM